MWLWGKFFGMTENYFSLLGVDKTYDIDISTLKANNLRLQHSLHPDRYANQEGSQKITAANKLAQINQAFNTLKSSYLRGEYLLSLKGIEKKSESETIKDPHLLIEQMDLREQLSDIRQLANPEEALENFSQKVNKKVVSQQQKISNLFKHSSTDEAIQPTQLELITDALTKLRFLNKLQQEISRFEEQLDDY